MPSRSRLVRALVVAASCIVIVAGQAAAARADSTSSISRELNGRVIDESGGAVVGATVTLSSSTRSGVRTQTTNDRGEFSFPDLGAGEYVITAELEQFDRASHVVQFDPATPAPSMDLVLHAGGLFEDVVVTATRTATETANLPAPVTVVSSATIESRNVTRLGDALTQVPGLYLPPSAFGQLFAGTGTGAFSLRGMNQQRTLVLLDGQPLQDGSGGSVNFRTVFMPEVNRVEVVPGAFSSLYGSNAIGGVINIITKQPDANGGTVMFRQGHGDASSTQGNLYGQRRHGRLGLAGGMGYADNRSYLAEYVVRTPVSGVAGTAVSGAIPTTTREGVASYIVGDKNRAPWKEKHASAKVAFDLTSASRLTGGVVYSDSKTRYTRFNSYLRDAGGNEITSGTLGINGQRVSLTESNFVTSAPIQEAATRVYGGVQTLVNQRLPLAINVARIGRENNFPTASTTALWNSGTGSFSDSPNANIDASAVLTLPYGRSLVTGASYHRETLARRNYALSTWRDTSTITATNSGSDAKTSVASVFAQQELSVGGALTLYAGARVDRWTTEGTYFQNTTPASTIEYPHRGVTSFSPKVSAVYRPVESVTVRGSVGRSFRAPTNSDLYSTTIISASQSSTGFLTTQGNPNMQPERGTGIEFGSEWRVTSRHKVVVTYYQTNLTDLIYSKNVSSSLTERINAGAATVRGIEATGEARLTHWLTVSAHATRIGSEITRNDADATSVGKRLTSSPEYLVGADALISVNRLTGSLTVSHVGKAFVLAQNTDTVSGVPGSNDIYTVAHAKVGYRLSKGLAAHLAVNNLSDRAYYVFYRMPGRNATFDLTWTF